MYTKRKVLIKKGLRLCKQKNKASVIACREVGKSIFALMQMPTF